MKCRICGKDNTADAVKCKQCNALLRRAEASAAAVAPAAPTGRGKAPLLMAAVAGVVVIAAMLYFGFLRGPSGEPPQAVAAAPKPVALEQQIGDEVRKLEKAQQQELAELSLEGLYGTPSFATREAIMQYSFAVKELEERRVSHERQWQAWRPEVLKRIQDSGKSAEEKAALVKKVESALSASEAQGAKARAASKQWAHVTLDLYDYAASNAEHLDARGAEMSFRDAEVAEGFRGRLARAQRLQQEAEKLASQAEQTRRSRLKEAGITVPD
jgi:hypothetical protein